MAFAYSANLQTRICFAVWGVPLANLDANQKVQLDGTWTSGSLSTGAAYDAYVDISLLSQYFEQASSTPDVSFPQPAWDRLFVAKTAMILTKTVRPDRYAVMVADHEAALDEVVDPYAKTLATAAFSSSNTSQLCTIQSIRYFVIDKCVRRREAGPAQGLRRRLFPPIESIDSETQWVLNYLWNKATWRFRRRQITAVIDITEFSDATWTESTKTITKATTFSASIPAGARARITAGTNANTGVYLVNSATANTLVLDESIGATDGSTDIDGSVAALTFRGMRSGEVFDSIASRELYYDGNNSGQCLRWVDPSEAARLAATYVDDDGMPMYFCTEVSGSTVTWQMFPFPDADYTLKGAVYVTGPGTPSSLTDTTIFSKFPAEFLPIIRDLVLARILLSFATSDAERYWQHANELAEMLLPVFVDSGAPSKMTSVLDVYQDESHQVGTRRWGW